MKDTSTARISCMADTKWDFIISSNITNKSTSEIEHALMHLDDAKNKIDLTKTITTYDRFYNSIEIMFKTMLLDSYFIIRGKTHTFKKQQNKIAATAFNPRISRSLFLQIRYLWKLRMLSGRRRSGLFPPETRR